MAQINDTAKQKTIDNHKNSGCKAVDLSIYKNGKTKTITVQVKRKRKGRLKIK
jgi:hypothetical protein